MSTNAKASIHIKPCNIAQSEAHNRRDKEYLKSLDPKKIYIRLDLTSENETYISPGMGGKTLQEYLNMLRDLVKEKTGRAMQEEDVKYKDKNGKTHSRRGSSPLREGVVVIKETTTMEDLLKFTDNVQERWGIDAIQIHIHRDEGHYEDVDRRMGWKPNLHAHIVWDWMDHSTGKSRKLSAKDMSQMQDLLAEVLEMQRGQRKSETGLEHLERNEFILKKQEAKNQALREDRDNLLSTLKSIGNAMDIKEEDLFVHNLATDPLVNAALESINSELATPFPVLGGKEEWRTDRLKAVKKILTDLQTKLIEAKAAQKEEIQRAGKALYKQTKKNIADIIEKNQKLQSEKDKLTKENAELKEKLSRIDEKAVRKIQADCDAANRRAERSERIALRERTRADNAETKVREILAVPEINRFWERIKRNKDAFLKLLNQRIADAERAIYSFAKNRDIIFSNKTELIIGNGIISEAILCGLDPTNDDQRKKAADNLLERIDWKGTYQSSYELAVSRTEDLSNEISVSSQLLENLILAAGGRGVTGSGGGGSNNELTNWDGTKKNTGWSRSR